jgi:integrase
MPNARFYLKQVTEQKKETLIYLYFIYNNNRLRISTETSIQPKYWNNKDQIARQVRGFTDKADRINKKLKEKGDAIEDAYEVFKQKGTIPTPDQLKAEYLRQLTPDAKTENPDFWKEHSKFIESSKGRVVNDVIKDYKSLIKHLKGFEKHQRLKIDFDSFNYSFYQNFIHYLSYDAVKPNGEKGLATNTVGKQIKNLKAFLNHCFKHEIVDRFDLSNFKTMSEDTDAIYLSEDEISMIYKCDLTDKPELEESRNLLVLGCQIGLRSNDLFRLKPEMVHGDMIRIKTRKSDKPVVIPLQPYTKEIIQKYNGDFPNKKNKATFRAQIKEIGKLASINSDVVITSKKGIEKVDNFYKKYELISSHTCRRSFCTNQYLRGIPTVLLMKISGHSTEKAFMRYIKIDEEMAAKKMMEYWNKKADK